MKRRSPTVLAAALALAGTAAPQSNADPEQDVALGLLGSLSWLDRTGSFPGGENAFAMATTACNLGGVDVPWLLPMQEDHPFVAFLVARESNGRFVQISDRSSVKHGFFALSNGQCTPCENPSNGTFLGVGCSSTCGVGSNGNDYWLGPADEVDPWLGAWSAECSLFDRGEPPVAPAEQCDGIRSYFGTGMGPIGHRVRVADAALDVPGAAFAYQACYVVAREPLAARENNAGSRPFTPTWNGSQWRIVSSGSLLPGTILNRWSGATVHVANNAGASGAADGSVAVGVAVTERASGVHRYEYALHCIDNSGGFSALRIPLTPGAVVSDLGFSDVDDDPANDWVLAVADGELVASAPAGNPLLWNTIYNVWFDCTAEPEYVDAGAGATLVRLDQLVVAPGADPSVAVVSRTPTGPSSTAPSTYCTAKVNSQGCTPSITFTGAPSVTATAAFEVGAVEVLNGKQGLLFYGIGPAANPFQGGFKCAANPVKRTPIQSSGGNPPPDDCSGTFAFDFNVRIQSGSDPALVPGRDVYAQYWSRDPVDPFTTSLTDGLAFVVGS